MTETSEEDRTLHSQRIADSLADQIRNGTLRDGERLASESQLAKEFGVARGTMRSALGILKAQDLVTTRPGVGSFVAYQGSSLSGEGGWTAASARAGVPTVTEVLSIDKVDAPEHLRQSHSLTGSGYRIVRRRLSGTTPVSLEVSFLPENELLDLLMERGLLGGSISMTMKAAGMIPHSGTQVVRSEVPPEGYRESLGANSHERYLVTRLTSEDAQGRLVEYVTAYLDPELFSIHINTSQENTNER